MSCQYRVLTPLLWAWLRVLKSKKFRGDRLSNLLSRRTQQICDDKTPYAAENLGFDMRFSVRVLCTMESQRLKKPCFCFALSLPLLSVALEKRSHEPLS